MAENPEASAETSRLEMFSDGVFAIAITLLVIEIPIPEFGHGVEAMRETLAHEWPAYLSYVIGFLAIGSVWMNHHHVFKYISGTNQPFLGVNVLFLMTIAFIPWVTAVLAESLRSGPEAEFAVIVYLSVLVTMAWAFNAIWFTARAFGFTRDNLDPDQCRAISLSYPLGAGVMTLALLISFVSAIAAILIYTALVAFYIVKGPEAQLRRAKKT
jgi:uncharacterized membrane protein